MIHKFNREWGKVKIKSLEKGDIENLRILRNKQRNWFIYSEEITNEDQIKWFESYKINKNDYMFSIHPINEQDRFIGAVALYEINEESKTAEFGRLLIDKEAVKKKGLGYDATMCACSIGFEQLGLNKILLEVFEENISAIKTYQKAGFDFTNSQELGNGKSIVHMELTIEKFENLVKGSK